MNRASRNRIRAGRLRLRAVPALCVLMLLPMSVSRGWAEDAGSGNIVTERNEITVNQVADGESMRLVVDNRLGNVHIEGHDQHVLVVSAVRRAPDRATLDRLEVSLIPGSSNAMRVRTLLAPAANGQLVQEGQVGVDLHIQAPRQAAVEARLWNGTLIISGMENGAELNANRGNIEVRNASGRIVTHLARGRQQLIEVYGVIHAQGITGNMELNAVRGQRLAATMHEGDIRAHSIAVHELMIRTIRGDIWLRGHMQAGGQYWVGNLQGQIEVALAIASPISMIAYTRTGTITLPGGHRHRSDGPITRAWHRGNGAPGAIELRSRAGNIRFSLVQ